MSKNTENNKTIIFNINSIDTLKAYLEEIPDLVVAIHNSVVDKISKQCVQQAKSEIIPQINADVRDAIRTELEDTNFCEFFQKQQNWHYPYKLTDQFKEVIYDEVKQFLRDEVKQIVQDAFGPLLQEARAMAGQYVDNIIDEISKQNINDLVKRRLNCLLKQIDNNEELFIKQ